MESLEQRQLLAADIGVNIVLDPGFEDYGANFGQGVPSPWNAQLENPFIRPYGGNSVPAVANKPPGGGTYVLYGGDQPASALAQVIDLTAIASVIDQGEVYADLSAYIGGWQNDNDTGQVYVAWRDGSNQNLQIDDLGQVNAGQRNNVTTLLPREIESIQVPMGTRNVYVEARMDRLGNDSNEQDNDGTVDNVSLELFFGDPHDNTGTTFNSDIFFPTGSLDITFPPGGVEYGDLTIELDTLKAQGGDWTYNAGSLLIGSLILENNKTTLGSNLSVQAGSIDLNNGTLELNLPIYTGNPGAQVTAFPSSLVAGKGFDPNSLPADGSLNIDIRGDFRPGNSPGVFNSGSLTLQNTTNVEIELDGPTTGSSYDQINVIGSVVLGGANLDFDLGYEPAAGQAFTIVSNDGTDPINGTFAIDGTLLPEGTKFLIDGKRFGISYVGGDGNDVVVLRNRPPESDPQTVVLEEDTFESFAAAATDPDGDAISFSLVTPPSNAATFDFRNDGTFDYQAIEHFGGADSFTYSVTDGDLTSNFTIDIDLIPVADAPTLLVTDAEGDEGTPIPLSIASTLVDIDGSETLTFQLAGIPEGTSLNQGVRDSVSGNWDLLPADLAGLTIESPDNQAYDIGVFARATESNFSGNFDFAETYDMITVTVNNLAPTITVSDQIAGSQLLRSWTDLITITDPGYADTPSATVETFTYSIDWGDGSAVDNGTADLDHLSGLPTGGNPSALTAASIDASHTYANDGRYDVTVTVTDDDGDATVEVFEVQVMIRLLDVAHGDDSTTLLFTDPIDATSIDHASVRVMGNQSGLVNDTTEAFVVSGPNVTVPLTHRGFAGEKLTVIFPADRDEINRTGVWSQRSNPIYQPEIDTYVVPATGGTGRWIRSETFDRSTSGNDSRFIEPGDLNRDQELDFALDSTQFTRDAQEWQWTPSEHTPYGYFGGLQLVDNNGDGVLEPITHSNAEEWVDADFDLDGEIERFIATNHSGTSLNGFHVDGDIINPIVEASGGQISTFNGAYSSLGDFDGDGDQDVVIINRDSEGWIWVNPIRSPLPSGETVFELSSPAFSVGSDSVVGLNVADFNSDGLDDIHVTKNEGIRVALSTGVALTGTAVTWPLQHTVNSGQEIFGSSIGDFDGDGDVDLVSSYRDNIGGQYGVHLALNDGNASFSPGLYFDVTIDGQLTTGDFNADGAIDLIFGDEIWLNPPVAQGAITEDLEQYASLHERNSGQLGKWFDFEGDHGVTFEQSDFDVTGPTVSFWNRDTNDNWSQSQSFTLQYDPNIGNFYDPYDLVIHDDSAALFYRDYSSAGTMFLQFYNFQPGGTWSVAESFSSDTYDASVAIEGDQAVAIVRDDTGFASAITYQRDVSGVWTENVSKRITNLVTHYDAPIILQGSHLFIGQIYGGTNSDGIVNIYTDSGSSWTLQSEVENPADHYNFGTSIAYDNGVLAVGSQFAGPVSVFQSSDFVSWSPLQTIQAPVDTYDDFGESLALKNGKLVIGNVGGINPDYIGNVYIYQRDAQTGNFELEQTLQSPNPQAQDDFGYVDFGENELWIGAPRVRGVASESGYLFRMPIAAPPVFDVVTNTNDSGAGSLRAAIEFANSNPGADTITFDIPGSGPHVIDVLSPLPAITDSVIINGASEPDFAGSPVVVLDGATVSGATTDGLRVIADQVSIQSLEIVNFPGDGIEVANADDSSIETSIIHGNTRNGVLLTNSVGTTVASNNLFDNGATGVQIVGTGSSANTIDQNLIGIVVDEFGTASAMGNHAHGINVLSASNLISQNIVSGNDRFGIAISGDANTLLGNFVGTDHTGAFAIANGNHGVLIKSAGNVIGGLGLGEPNIVSGNNRSGLVFSGASATNNYVAGNFLGVADDGVTPIPNSSYGLQLNSSSGNTIGGLALEERNTISGNGRSGVVLSNGSSQNLFENNAIGVDATGHWAVGNGSVGVFILGASADNVFSDNVIAANASSQISIGNPNSSGNQFTSNMIGVTQDGSAELAGSGTGIFLKARDNVFDGNTIAGATSTGIHVSSTSASGNVITNNLIGTASQSLTEVYGMPIGVRFSNGAFDNLLGPANTIAYSTSDAVRNDSGGEGNTITQNVMAGNAFGIDLGTNGVTPNDGNPAAADISDDADTGPNRLQNTATSLIVNATPISGTQTSFEFDYFVDSNPANASYPLTVEFFVSDPVVAQGIQYVISDTYTVADYNAGGKNFSAVINNSDFLVTPDYGTATVTDNDGSTSEFTAPPVGITFPASAAYANAAPAATINYNSLDVSRDGQITQNDALMVINELSEQHALNAQGEQAKGSHSPDDADVNKDGRLTPADLLEIVNFLADQHRSDSEPDEMIALIDSALALDDDEEETFLDDTLLF
ncbi:MAG: right-handed parallel beta-helix repeat-containing protein [Rubripirellula sp.]